MEITQSRTSLALNVKDTSQIGEARRVGSAFAQEHGLGKSRVGEVSIIITELANNLCHYAVDGRLIIQSLPLCSGNAIEILAVDSGPGIPDVSRCLQDGFSTSATPGNGLGAVSRLSTEFDIYSLPARGTVVLSRVYSERTKFPAPPSAMIWGAVSIPAPGAEVCGDSWRFFEREGKVGVLVADGLGHGPLAARAAQAVADVFEVDSNLGAAQVLENAYENVRATRGAAAAVANVDLATGAVTYAGIGNISGTMLLDDERRGFFSQNGTVGMQIRKVQETEYHFPRRGIIVMHSDGLQEKWNLRDYPGLQSRHPAIIAGVLARDFKRGRDDLTVVVLRWRGVIGE